MCILPRCIFKTIFRYCSPCPSNVYWRFSKHMSILKSYKEENCFCSGKMFTSKKLTGVETLLPVCIIFQLNENTNKFIVNSVHSDCISHPNTHTHYTYIYIYIYIYIYLNMYTYVLGNRYWNSWGIFRLRYLQLQLASSQSVVAV